MRWDPIGVLTVLPATDLGLRLPYNLSTCQPWMSALHWPWSLQLSGPHLAHTGCRSAFRSYTRLLMEALWMCPVSSPDPFPGPDPSGVPLPGSGPPYLTQRVSATQTNEQKQQKKKSNPKTIRIQAKTAGYLPSCSPFWEEEKEWESNLTGEPIFPCPCPGGEPTLWVPHLSDAPEHLHSWGHSAWCWLLTCPTSGTLSVPFKVSVVACEADVISPADRVLEKWCCVLSWSGLSLSLRWVSSVLQHSLPFSLGAQWGSRGAGQPCAVLIATAAHKILFENFIQVGWLKHFIQIGWLKD